MKKSTILLWAIVAMVVLFSVTTYNGLVSAEETVNQKWAQVDNQLKRRADLIPNLVNTVQGYAAHEKEIMQSLAEARTKLAGAQTPAEKAAAERELSTALSRLLMVVENYPNLKANEQFRQLMDQLEGTENRIAVARKDYNDAVASYNIRIQRFPSVIVARLMGLSQKEYFQVNEEDKAVPQVDFGDM